MEVVFWDWDYEDLGLNKGGISLFLLWFMIRLLLFLIVLLVYMLVLGLLFGILPGTLVLNFNGD